MSAWTRTEGQIVTASCPSVNVKATDLSSGARRGRIEQICTVLFPDCTAFALPRLTALLPFDN